MRKRWWLAIAGAILILAGGLLAQLTQTSGGIRIEDIRFKGAKGNTMSALLYIPPNATAQTPAPGILALTYYPAFALGGTFVTPSAYLPQGITNQIMVWAIINAIITLALLAFARKRASRTGIIVRSILIALIVGYAALWLSDLLFKIDFRFWIVALKLMNAKQFLIFLIYLGAFHGVFRGRAARAAPEFLEPRRRPRSSLPDQHPGADARLHRAAGPAIRHAVVIRKTV